MLRTSLLTLIASPLILAPATGRAAAPEWRVTEISGAAQVGPVGRVRPVSRGTSVKPGDVVSTGVGARVVLTRGEEFVVVSPSSRLRLPEATAPGGIMQWIEDFGTAVFKIQKKSTPHFGVQTPYLAAVVKGTTFSVTVGASGASVQVVEGAVEVSTLDGGATDLIRPGVIARVASGDRYRLTVDGATSKVITSPNTPASSAPAAPAPVAAAEGEAQVASAVSDEAPALDAISGGLVVADAVIGDVVGSVAGAERVALAANTVPPPVVTPGDLPPPPATVDTVPDKVNLPAPVETPPVTTPPVVVEVVPVPTSPVVVPVVVPVATPPVVVPPITTPPVALPPVVSIPVTTPPTVTQPTIRDVLAGLIDRRGRGRGGGRDDDDDDRDDDD